MRPCTQPLAFRGSHSEPSPAWILSSSHHHTYLTVLQLLEHMPSIYTPHARDLEALTCKQRTPFVKLLLLSHLQVTHASNCQANEDEGGSTLPPHWLFKFSVTLS